MKTWKTQKGSDFPKVTKLKAMRPGDTLVASHHSVKKHWCLLCKQCNKNEKYAFSNPFLKELAPGYGNSTALIHLLLVTQKLAIRYLEIMPKAFIVTERTTLPLLLVDNHSVQELCIQESVFLL